MILSGGDPTEREECYRKLMRKYWKVIAVIAASKVADPREAEDITQEAFIRVAGRFRHLRTPDAFDAYLRRTVVNLCMSHHRRRRVERAYLEHEGGRRVRAVDPPDVEGRDELRRALAALPMRQRAAVVLRYYDDLPEQRVAEVLGCSVPAARSLVFRAMETLRTTIGGDET